MEKARVYCVTGIDTGIGKTVATGLLARSLVERGERVITQKMVQTGCVGLSEDIVQHRQIMGIPLLAEDREGVTCPYVFPVPCSPHLAARLAGKKIDCERIRTAVLTLSSRYDIVLLEGAGGLFVPLQEEYTLLDFVSGEGWPIILVTSSRLGSINHTLASLDALHHRGMDLRGVVYNRFHEADPKIGIDSLDIITKYIEKYGFSCPVVELHDMENHDRDIKDTDFSMIFG